MEEYCRAALSRGIQSIGFAEHVDFDPGDPDYGYYQYDACARAVLAARERYAPDLEVLLGAELDYQEWFEDSIAEFIQDHSFDFVIGSVHAVGGARLMGPEYCAGRSAHQAYADYFDAVRSSAESGLFDIIGHVGYAVRRGLGSVGAPPYSDLMEHIVEALHAIVRARVCLEINTSGMKHAGASPYPDVQLLEAFRHLGGERVSFGSDAHGPADVGVSAAALEAYGAALHGCRVVTYRNREPILMSPEAAGLPT